MTTKIYVLGNEFLEEDSMAKKVVDSLKKDYNIKKIKSFEEIDLEFHDPEKPLILIDVIKNLGQVRTFHNLDKFKKMKIITSHDLDTSFYLNLLQQIGEVKEIEIIGIPQKGDPKKIRKELIKELETLKLPKK